MSPRGPRKGGLAQAHEQIAGLMDELDQTLELVAKLSERGEDEAAIRLIDGQRAELYRVVNSISLEVAADGPATWMSTMRRHATALAAAALLVLSTVAVSVHAITRQTPVERAEHGLRSATTVADPVERIRLLIELVEVTRTLPPAESDSVTRDIIPALDDAVRDAEEEGADDAIVRKAEKVAEDLREGRPPPPPGAPGTDEGPLESVTELLPGP